MARKIKEIDASDFIKPYEPEPEEQFEEEKEKYSLFDFIKSVTSTKRDLLKDDDEAKRLFYQKAFSVRKGLSFYPDTVLIANELNVYPGIPSESQYYYLMGAIRKGSRYSEWFKGQKNEDLDAIQKFYGVRRNLAKQYISLLSEDEVKEIRKKTSVEKAEKKTRKKKTK